jgi:hypothetical protein
MTRYKFKPDEIEQVEKILINWNKFCEKRTKILTDFDTNFQVQACPWSWKTTLLVWKIFLLAQKIDLTKESACILTHTNVAVDEIKEKIKKARWNNNIDKKFLDNVERLLKYPNYIWTLQSFIDKYLAIPSYLQEYWKRPNKIDNDYSEWFLKKGFFTNLSSETSKFLSQKFNPYKLDFNMWLDKIMWTNFDITNNNLVFTSTNSWKITLKDTTNKKYIEIFKLFHDKIKNEWLLTFDEANLFALKYLSQNENKLQKLIQSRYNFLFLDEIQDTSGIHINILNTLFNNSNTLIQGFWDENQSILEQNSDGVEFTLFENNESIDSSRRLSTEISNTVWKCAIKPQPLEWIVDKNIPVYFYLYDTWSEQKLIEFYKEKIIEYDLLKKWNLFKAIWWTHDWISKYCSLYEWKTKKRKDKFIDYLSINLKDNFKKQWFKLYKDEILEWLTRGVNISKIKNWDKWFSKSTLTKYLKENNKLFYHQLLLRIIKWTKELENNIFDYSKINIDKIMLFLWTLEIDWLKLKLQDDFFKNWATILVPKSTVALKWDSIDIEFNSIHWVKWETHTGTLLLDTKALSSETNKRILEFIDDESEKTVWPNIKKSINLFYVWMTRATDLLVIWINKDKLNKKHIKTLEWFNKINENIYHS